MGAWVLASVFCVCLLIQNGYAYPQNVVQRIQVRPVRYTGDLELTKGQDSIVHSAVPNPEHYLQASTNYQPYKAVKFSSEDAVDQYGKEVNVYNNEYGYPVQYGEAENREKYTSIESDGELHNGYLDTEGYNQYKSATTFNLEGPRQLETISTNSFHKEVGPYDVSSFNEDHHKENEEHAEVHYHQHKHLHKHNHKQEHKHSHKQDHKHEHGHKHEHQAHHGHKHESHHKHSHHSEHKHGHKNEHHHKHHQEHKHSHHGSHKHEHKHNQEHKHDHHHGHKHSHQSGHKHSHHNEHKHDHGHDHKHHNEHKHQHDHHSSHKHNHGHKDEHKHSHHEEHNHKHKKW